MKDTLQMRSMGVSQSKSLYSQRLVREPTSLMLLVLLPRRHTLGRARHVTSRHTGTVDHQAEDPAVSLW